MDDPVTSRRSSFAKILWTKIKFDPGDFGLLSRQLSQSLSVDEKFLRLWLVRVNILIVSEIER